MEQRLETLVLLFGWILTKIGLLWPILIMIFWIYIYFFSFGCQRVVAVLKQGTLQLKNNIIPYVLLCNMLT